MKLRTFCLCLALLLVAAFLPGCSTVPSTSTFPGPSPPPASGIPGTQGTPPAPGTTTTTDGLVKEYDVTQEAAWEIAKTVFRWEGAGPIQEERKKGYMLTSMGGNALYTGTVMGAWIEPGRQVLTSKVTILTKRRVLGSPTAFTEAIFHRRFAQAVAMVKQGKVLPKVAPPMPA